MRMTPAEAAREVAERYRQEYQITYDGTEGRLIELARAFTVFADLLEEPPSPCPSPCPDGIACPMADDTPRRHYR